MNRIIRAEKENFNETLIIIGNGFDLHSKLESSYNDYFQDITKDKNVFSGFRGVINNIQRDFNSADSAIINFITSYRDSLITSLSIWHILFLFKIPTDNNVMWCDVESEMFKSLLPANIEKININPSVIAKKVFWENVKTSIVTDLESLVPPYELINRLRSINLSLNIRLSALIQLKYTNTNANNSLVFLKGYKEEIQVFLKDWEVFLLDQLQIFEQSFMVYLKATLNKNIDYLQNSKDLLAMLVSNPNNANKKYRVMNFNYTTIDTGRQQKTENVHGYIGNDSGIIFGIDQTSVLNNHLSAVFSKTFRKINKLTRYQNKRITQILNKNINTIIFYGHSLNKQDYSYFQSIFDYLNIYDKEIKLIFLYSYYDGKSKQEIENDVSKKVLYLLSEYGKTMDNKYKGQNLIHKLLMEARLFIELVIQT